MSTSVGIADPVLPAVPQALSPSTCRISSAKGTAVKNRLFRLAGLAAALTIVVSGCSLDSANTSSGNVVNVVIGYQSKTINTVTAGTLLRAQSYLERRLADI